MVYGSNWPMDIVAFVLLDMAKRNREGVTAESAAAAAMIEGVTAGTAAAASMIADNAADVPSHAPAEIEASPPRASAAKVLPASPATNRDRFRAALMPAQISCDLSSVQPDPGMRFSFQAIVLIVYPAQSNPVRRHVMLADGHGVAGVTVWNANVNAFSNDSIGRMAHFTKMSLVCCNIPHCTTKSRIHTGRSQRHSLHFNEQRIGSDILGRHWALRSHMVAWHSIPKCNCGYTFRRLQREQHCQHRRHLGRRYL